MEYHFDKRLRLNTEPQYKSLYKWAIAEFDEQSSKQGRDQIPWPWTLYFLATSCTFVESIELDRYGDDTASEITRFNQRQHIHIKLRSGQSRDDNYFNRARFSFLGTDRTIEDISLNVFRLSDASEKETCRAWGIVSYTAENDFRNETTDDCIGFEISINPQTFDRYVDLVRAKSVEEISFSVGGVEGFYSEWSPSISTNSVKVLASGKEQKVENHVEEELILPRLRKVDSFRLSMNSHVRIVSAKQPEQFDPRDNAPSESALDNASPEKSQTEVSALLQFNAELKSALKPLKLPAWLAVIILFLMLVFKH